jgi:hypothetical protein
VRGLEFLSHTDYAIMVFVSLRHYVKILFVFTLPIQEFGDTMNIKNLKIGKFRDFSKLPCREKRGSLRGLAWSVTLNLIPKYFTFGERFYI